MLLVWTLELKFYIKVLRGRRFRKKLKILYEPGPRHVLVWTLRHFHRNAQEGLSGYKKKEGGGVFREKGWNWYLVYDTTIFGFFLHCTTFRICLSCWTTTATFYRLPMIFYRSHSLSLPFTDNFKKLLTFVRRICYN